MKILVTGSAGLIGSEAVVFYCSQGYSVYGIDNNMREVFFGSRGDTSKRNQDLSNVFDTYTPLAMDIRDRDGLFALFQTHTWDLIIHCAAQPSHDLAAKMPLVDFEVNCLSTLNLLEATRLFCPTAVFIFMSTNKVYGDAPNELTLLETSLRYDFADMSYQSGIDETFRIDQSLHSLFGVSKASADLLVQEYGRYFQMKTAVFRGGCLTGPQHASVELHGFLSYLVYCVVKKRQYTIFGYSGKQVRDQIHSKDVIAAFDCFFRSPKSGAVYNLGGGRPNSASILEIAAYLSDAHSLTFSHIYSAEHRIGDHKCYYSNMNRFCSDFPHWTLTSTIWQIIDELVDTISVSNE